MPCSLSKTIVKYTNIIKFKQRYIKMIKESDPLYVGRKHACKLLRCSLNTLSNLIEDGHIHAYKCGGKTSKINVSALSIDRFQKQGGIFYKASSPDMTLEQFLNDSEGM